MQLENKIKKQRQGEENQQKLSSFQSTLSGTQMGVFCGDEQQIKTRDTGKAKPNRMKQVLELTLQPPSLVLMKAVSRV